MRKTLISFTLAFGASFALAAAPKSTDYHRRSVGGAAVSTGSESFSGTKTFPDSIVVSIQDGGVAATLTGKITLGGNVSSLPRATYSLGTINVDEFNAGAIREITWLTWRNLAGQQTGSQAAGAGGGISFKGDETNVAGARSIIIDARTSLTNSAAQLLSVQNAGVESFAATPGGGIRLNIPGGAGQPACAVGLRGSIWYTAGAGGVADKLEVCAKSAADAYAWIAVATPIP